MKPSRDDWRSDPACECPGRSRAGKPKTCYLTAHDARQYALGEWVGRWFHRMRPLRLTWYRCAKCPHWHVTKQRKSAGVAA